MKKALYVLSGGQDSTSCLFLTQDDYDEVQTITFNYGQRHNIELLSAESISLLSKATAHHQVDIRGILKSTSPLISEENLEQYESYDSMIEKVGSNVEKTFVPMRNGLFLTIAANHAIHYGCNTIITGICAADSANYFDCTTSFLSSVRDYVKEGTGNFRLDIQAPLIRWEKSKSVRKVFVKGSRAWGALAFTHTSYDGKYPPLDNNHANVLRAQGFLEAGLPDPLVIRAVSEGKMDLPTTPNYEDKPIHAYTETIIKEIKENVNLPVL